MDKNKPQDSSAQQNQKKKQPVAPIVVKGQIVQDSEGKAKKRKDKLNG